MLCGRVSPSAPRRGGFGAKNGRSSVGGTLAANRGPHSAPRKIGLHVDTIALMSVAGARKLLGPA